MKSLSGTTASADMSFGDHLEELRTRMIRSILSTLLGFIAIFTWHEEVLRFVVQPYSEIAHGLGMTGNLMVLGPTDAFFAYMKVSLIVSLLCTAPVWMWQFWAFVGAGLYDHEKKAVYKFAPPMIFLFAAGVSFGYLVLIPVGLRYLLSFADPAVLQNWIGLSEYMSLFTTLTLVLGITFQLPVIMALLSKIGLVGPSTFREKRRYFIFGAFFFGALLTPPDAVTQVLLATPLLFLFELGISCAWLVQGEGREPIDWPRWRRRGLVFLVIVIALGVFSERIMRSYKERLVGQNIRTIDGEREEGIPYFAMLERWGHLGFKPTLLFVLSSQDGVETVIAGNRTKSAVLVLNATDDRITVMSETAQEARFLVNSTTRSVRVNFKATANAGEFLGPMFLGMQNAAPEAVSQLDGLLFGLIGERPGGARALTDDDSEADRDTTRQAWLSWWRTEGKEWVYRP